MLSEYINVKVSLLIRYLIDMHALYWLTIFVLSDLLNNFVMNRNLKVAKKRRLFSCDEVLFMSVSTEKMP